MTIPAILTYIVQDDTEWNGSSYIIPVTVRMLLAASRPETNDCYCLQDGRKMDHFKLIAATRQVFVNSTYDVYQVEDGTGLLHVIKFRSLDECAAAVENREATLKENVYLKFIGSIVYADESKHFLATSVKPLDTTNQLTHHMLEVAYSHQQHQKRLEAATKEK